MFRFAFFLSILLASCAAVDDSASIRPAETVEMCGGIAGITCSGADDFCKLKEGECVAVADAAGICTTKPQICTMDYRPVCGCDGETYPNACAASAAGVSIASQSACTD